VDVNNNLVLVLPDTHFGSHDPAAVELAVRAASHLKPGRVVHLGDIVDMAVFSSHPPAIDDAQRASSFLNDEIEPARAWIKQIQKYSGTWIQLEGNHEFRIARWCAKNGMAGIGAYDLLEPRRLLGKDIDKFRWVPYSPRGGVESFYPIVPGKAIAVHGWSYAKAAAHIHLDKARSRSIVFGHCHRAMSVSTRDPFSGELLKAWSPGTLSTLAPVYHHGAPNDWTRGLCVMYIGKSGHTFTEYNVSITHKDSLVLPDGKELA